MKPVPEFTEALRLDYPLTPESVVVDCGAYQGNWSLQMSLRHRCRIFAFEPVRRFHEQAMKVLLEHDNVRLYNQGVGAKTRTMDFHVQNDSTGAFAGATEVEPVFIFNLLNLLDSCGVRFCHVIK